MGQYRVNTKVSVTSFGNKATSTTALTYTQLPAVVCDEVVLSLQPAATPQNIYVGVPLPLEVPTSFYRLGNLR